MKNLIMVFLISGFLMGCAANPPVSPGERPAAKLSDKDMKRLLESAETAYKSQRWEQARQLFQSALDSDKENQFALYRLGNIAFRRDEINKAADYFESVLRLNSAHSRSHYNLGVCRLIQARGHLQTFVLMKDPASDTRSIEKMVRQINEYATRQ